MLLLDDLELVEDALVDDPVALVLVPDLASVAELEEAGECEEFEEPDELVEELDEFEVVADGSFGVKLSLPLPKPMAAAAVPVPLTVIKLVSFLAVRTSWPLLLREALTCALVGRSTLMALIRSATVSLPVDW